MISIKNGSGNTVQDTPNATAIGAINPIRYRGYYYDNDTGLYYLQSRFYDPNTCRFINVDGFVSTGTGYTGFNMFAYCGNEPVGKKDDGGEREINALSVASETTTDRHVSCAAMNFSASGRFKSYSRDYVIDGYSLYFVNKQYGSKFIENCLPASVLNNSQSVFLLDCRNYSNDPNIKIIDSYNILNPIIQSEIIDCMISYDAKHSSAPNNWKRTKDSLVMEWDIHSLLSTIQFMSKSTDSADFNYKDEFLYKFLFNLKNLVI